jgi:prefoldin subunit 5
MNVKSLMRELEQQAAELERLRAQVQLVHAYIEELDAWIEQAGWASSSVRPASSERRDVQEVAQLGSSGVGQVRAVTLRD